VAAEAIPKWGLGDSGRRPTAGWGEGSLPHHNS